MVCSVWAQGKIVLLRALSGGITRDFTGCLVFWHVGRIHCCCWWLTWWIRWAARFAPCPPALQARPPPLPAQNAQPNESCVAGWRAAKELPIAPFLDTRASG